MPTPTSVSSTASSNVGLPAAGTVHGVKATPNDRVRSFTLPAELLQLREPHRLFSPAPTIFSTTSVPATPRLPVDQVELGTATSSFVTTVMIFRPSAAASSPAISKFMTSPS